MNLLRPRIIAGVAALAIIFILFSLAQEMNRRWQMQREVQRLDSQLKDMEHKVVELENLNQYFRTDDYQERLAREKLNYQAPGEKVVLIPEAQVPVSEPAISSEPPEAPPSIPMRWWRLFFVDDQPFTARS